MVEALHVQSLLQISLIEELFLAQVHLIQILESNFFMILPYFWNRESSGGIAGDEDTKGWRLQKYHG